MKDKVAIVKSCNCKGSHLFYRNSLLDFYLFIFLLGVYSVLFFNKLLCKRRKKTRVYINPRKKKQKVVIIILLKYSKAN
jgi:hypothetical protein